MQLRMEPGEPEPATPEPEPADPEPEPVVPPGSPVRATLQDRAEPGRGTIMI